MTDDKGDFGILRGAERVYDCCMFIGVLSVLYNPFECSFCTVFRSVAAAKFDDTSTLTQTAFRLAYISVSDVLWQMHTGVPVRHVVAHRLLHACNVL